MSVLVAGVASIAAGLGQSLRLLRLLETSLASGHLADRLLIEEILRRDPKVDPPAQESPGFAVSLRSEEVLLSRSPLPDVPMDRLTGEVSWEFQGRPRSLKTAAGLLKEPAG